MKITQEKIKNGHSRGIDSSNHTTNKRRFCDQSSYLVRIQPKILSQKGKTIFSCTPNKQISKENSSEEERRKMASSTAKITFRIVMAVIVLLLFFYVGRPLYWKISATVHDIRQNKQTVKEGQIPLHIFLLPQKLKQKRTISRVWWFLWFLFFFFKGLSQIVLEAQRTVGWYHDESDSGAREGQVGKNLRSATSRKLQVLLGFWIRIITILCNLT